MAETTMADKQYLAKILFTREKLDQKEVARRVGVTEKTMGKWVNDFNWKMLRNRLLVGKEEILSNMYEQLEELNNNIKARDKGTRYADTREADILIKYTAAIRNLETELAIADLVDSGIRFTKYIQQAGTTEQVMLFAELWNGFIQTSIKKA